MSTPQGPNGAEKGATGPAPKGPNGQESKTASAKPTPVTPPATAPDAAPAPDAPKTSEAPKAPAAPKAQAPANPEPTKAQEPAKPSDPPVKSAAADKPVKSGDAVEPSPTAQTTPVVRPPADQGAKPAQSGGVQRPAGGQTPPWQRGQQAPQNTPQTNLPGRGQGVDKAGTGNTVPQRASTQQPGKSVSGAPRTPQGAPKAPTRPVVTGTAAASLTGGADRSAAKAKSAVIDGPTRHIERKDLAKDLPDLSTVKHPLPTAAPVAVETAHAAPAAASSVTAAVPMAGDPLRATVQVRRIDPWSMLKVSAVISISLFFVWMVAVGLLYGILAGMGVWERLNSAFTDIVSESGGGGLITAGQVFGYATVIGLANTILLTAIATLGAFIYNLCTDLVGGLQVTLADPD